MRQRTAVALISIAALTSCEQMCSLKPAPTVASFRVEQRVDQVEGHLRRLASHNGLKLHGSFDNREDAIPPVNSLNIGTQDCAILAKKSDAVIVISLNVVEGRTCPQPVRTIFAQAKRELM